MNAFDIQFPTPLFSIDAGRTEVQVVASNATHNQNAVELDRIEATLRNLDQHIGQLRQKIQEQQDYLMTSVTQIAVQIAQTVLQSDQELVTQRLSQNIETALSAAPVSGEIELFIHPDCIEPIRSIPSVNEMAIQLKADDSIAKGDCRLEFGEAGLLACLQNQIEWVATNLGQLGDQTGGQP